MMATDLSIIALTLMYLTAWLTPTPWYVDLPVFFLIVAMSVKKD